MCFTRSVSQSTISSMLRGMLPRAVCGPSTISMLGKPSAIMPRKVRGMPCPVVLEPPPARPDDVDAVVGAGDAVEARGIDQDIEGEILGAGPQALRRDALDRRLVDVDQPHVVLVVDLEIAGLERQPARAEAVVLGDQLVGDPGIAHPLADLLGHEGAGELVGLPVGQHVGEVADPDAEARLAIELLPERLALLGRDLQRLARIGLVDEAGAGLPAALEDLGVGGLDRSSAPPR